jgi:hypothetical protein
LPVKMEDLGRYLPRVDVVCSVVNTVVVVVMLSSDPVEVRPISVAEADSVIVLSLVTV